MIIEQYIKLEGNQQLPYKTNNNNERIVCEILGRAHYGYEMGGSEIRISSNDEDQYSL